ncbi:MAG: hypothetical protein ACHQIM_11540 [Sphingobacteriales bacterium]
MAYIKISPKGRAFLKRGNVAAIVAAAIVEKKNEMLSDEGLVVKISDTTYVTIKSAKSRVAEVTES